MRARIGRLLRAPAVAVVGLWRALAAVPQDVVDALDPYAEYDRHREELRLLARGVLPGERS